MKPNLNGLLHGLASELVTREHAHRYLHDLAVDTFGVRSWSDVTDEQAKRLADIIRAKLREQRAMMFDAMHPGEERISVEQIAYARALLQKLGWSKQYFARLLSSRYDESSLETMPDWKGVRLIALMKRRVDSKASRARKAVKSSSQQ